MKFTQNQERCITTRGRDLIVSAGAGAGKTATLVERLYSLLADERDPLSLDELLVVTFSRMAAHEMRDRLAIRLRNAIQEDDIDKDLREHLERQLFLLPRAQISTLHSFCLTVITENPEAAGLAPGFELMSDEEVRLVQQDFFRARLEECLRNDDKTTTIIRRLYEEQKPLSGFDRIVGFALELHAFLMSLPDPEEYVRRTCGADGDCNGDTITPNSRTWRLLNLFLREHAAPLCELLTEKTRSVSNLSPRMMTQMVFLTSVQKRLVEILRCDDPLAAIRTSPPGLAAPRLAGGRDDPATDDSAFREIRSECIDAIKKFVKAVESLLATDLVAQLRSSARVLDIFLRDVVLKWSNELFDQHLRQRRLTFAHLEHLALRTLRTRDGQPTDVACLYRQRYRQILVDEFQDVNDVQNLLLRAVATPPGGPGGGNLFTVGDVKQSIYEFRLADPTLFLQRYDGSTPYDDALAPGIPARIDLQENFRSDPRLLVEFNRIFRFLIRKDTIGIEYSPTQEFVAGSAESSSGRPVQFGMHVLHADLDDAGDEDEDDRDVGAETVYTASLIEKMGPPWKDICVLLRSMKGTAAELVEELSVRNVPVFCDSQRGFLTAVEVIEIRSLLLAIYNPHDDVALLGTLRGPAARWSEEELFALRAVDPRGVFIDNLRAAASSPASSLHSRAAGFLARLEEWQRQSTRHSMADFFGLLFDDLHLVERASVRPGGDQRKRNLLYLVDRARQFDQFQLKGLGSFLRFLDDLIENDQDFSPPSPLPEDADVVRIMSVHKSKGMQFPVVICPFLGKKFNEMSIHAPFLCDREHGAATRFLDMESSETGINGMYAAVRHFRRMRARGEEIRLFYVALTRAQRAVHLIGSAKKPEERLVHQTTLPSPAEVLNVRCPMEWMMMHLARRFEIMVDDGEKSVPPVGDGIASAVIVSEKPCAEIVPIRPDSVDSSARESIIGDLEKARKRIEALVNAEAPPLLRAKVSVTELKRLYDSMRDPETPPMRLSGRRQDRIDWIPARFDEATAGVSAAERGRATHRFLALCDIEAISKGKQTLTAERDRLADRGLLTEVQAPLADLEGIAWFLNSDLGKRLRGSLVGIQRELPFVARIDTGEIMPGTPPDIVVLQGVADLLFRDGGDWVLVDFKTDFCGRAGERLDDLTAGYTPQLQLYRLGIERTLRQPVGESWLVFLHGRRICRVESTGEPSVPWQQVVRAGAVVYTDPEKHVTKTRDV